MVQIGKWELTGRRRGVDKGKCRLYGEENQLVRILLNFIEDRSGNYNF